MLHEGRHAERLGLGARCRCAAALAAGASMAACRLTAQPFRGAALELPELYRIVTPFGWSRNGPALHEGGLLAANLLQKQPAGLSRSTSRARPRAHAAYGSR